MYPYAIIRTLRTVCVQCMLAYRIKCTLLHASFRMSHKMNLNHRLTPTVQRLLHPGSASAWLSLLSCVHCDQLHIPQVQSGKAGILSRFRSMDSEGTDDHKAY